MGMAKWGLAKWGLAKRELTKRGAPVYMRRVKDHPPPAPPNVPEICRVPEFMVILESVPMRNSIAYITPFIFYLF